MAAKMIPGSGPSKKGIIFLHIPKTGGTSISKALRRHYRFSNFHVKSRASAAAALPDINQLSGEPGLYDEVQALRLNLVLYWAQAGKKFLTGHVWNDPRLVNLKTLDYLIVTCLRDPVSRWFSTYFYDSYKTGVHAKIEQDIDQFLDSERARSMGSTYVRYVGGLRKDRDYESRQAIEDAINMLHTIDIIGYLDNLDHLRSQVFDKLGFKLKISHRRRSPADEIIMEKIKGSKEYRKAVETLCEPDMELYERARTIYF